MSIKSFPDCKYLLQENYGSWNKNRFFKCNSISFLIEPQEVFYNTSVNFNMCSFCCTQNVQSIINFSPRVLQHVFSYCSKSVFYSCLQICNIWNWCRKHLSLTNRHKKKSRAVISGDRGGQVVGPSLPIHLFGNVASKKPMNMWTPVWRCTILLENYPRLKLF